MSKCILELTTVSGVAPTGMRSTRCALARAITACKQRAMRFGQEMSRGVSAAATSIECRELARRRLDFASALGLSRTDSWTQTPSSGARLADLVCIAVDESLRRDGRFGLLWVGATAPLAPGVMAEVDASLAPFEFVLQLNATEFVIGAAMLEQATDVRRRADQWRRLTCLQDGGCRIGAAIYPLDGYTAADLLASARVHAELDRTPATGVAHETPKLGNVIAFPGSNRGSVWSRSDRIRVDA